MLLKIQEFAEFCGLSIRALHLYDKIGLFTPNTTDKSNGYRYYDTEQMLELNTIISFKKVGFSLNEIKEMKEQRYTKEMVMSRLDEKKKENLRQIEYLSYNNEMIDAMQAALCQDKPKADPAVDEKHLAKIICMENDKLENEFSQILWL